jgi:hypothetical protein
MDKSSILLHKILKLGPSKHEALSSNPSATKKKKNQNLKLGIEGNFLNLIKICIKKQKQNTVNTLFNDGRQKNFPLRSGTKQGYLLCPLLLFNISLKVLATKAISICR